MTRQRFMILSLLVLLAVGCSTAVPEPTPTHTAVSIVAETPTTVAAEVIVMETAVVEPLPTPELKLTSISTPIAAFHPTTPTPLSLSQLDWLDNLYEKIVVSDDSITWSPVANKFIFDECTDQYLLDSTPERIIYLVDTDDFLPVTISSSPLVCNATLNFVWRPDGQQVVFNGAYADSLIAHFGGQSEIFLMNQDGTEFKNTGYGENDLEIAGWMDNEKIVFYGWSGGGHRWVYMMDVNKMEIPSWAFIHAGIVEDVTEDYVVMNTGAEPNSQYSVAAFSTVPVKEMIPIGELPDPFIRILSIDTGQIPYETFFNSRYETTLPNSNQVLILTWATKDKPQDQLLGGLVQTNLELWNLDTNELTLIVPGGIFGRFSPEQHYLVYLTPETESPRLQLLDRVTGDVILAQSVYAEANPHTTLVSAFTSFSPNGRFLTFYSPTPELMIYDLEKGEFLPPVTAVPYTPLWSPDNGRFVYNDPENGLSIYEAATQTTYPLTISGGERLSNPQWSFDGAYLSVVVLQEDGDGETAVLQMP